MIIFPMKQYKLNIKQDFNAFSMLGTNKFTNAFVMNDNKSFINKGASNFNFYEVISKIEVVN